MKLSHKIKMDLVRQGIPPRITMVQGDAHTRWLEIALYADKRPWKVPENVSVLIRYRKPDRTSGSYDTLADGTSAVSFSGNRIYILIAPEVLSLSGTVALMITILRGEQRLSTFSMDLVVQSDCVSGWDDAEAAAWIAAFLPSPDGAVSGQYLTVDTVDENGHVLSLQATDAGADGGYYTPSVQLPAEDEMLFQFTPSDSSMPDVPGVTVRLPVGPQGEKGEKGDTGEQGIQGEKGEPGVDGAQGADGLTPYIGSNGNWWIGQTDTGTSASGSGSCTVSTPRIILLENAEFDGFAMNDYYGAMIYNLNTSLTLELGETYIVNWDGIEYPCVAVSAAPMGIDGLALGKASIGGIEGGNEDAPFVIGWTTAGATLFALDDATSHTVGIYQEDPYATESYVKNYVEQYISEALGGDY